MNGKRIRLALPLTLAVLSLVACGSGGAGGGTAPGSALGGSVHGGQSPVGGASITLYAAGSGSASATVLGTATTNAGGSWTMNGVICPSPGVATYVIASGGNPGLPPPADNTALQLMLALGPCGSMPAYVNITELTTVAAAYALNGFIGPGGPGLPSGVSNVHGDNPGLANAMSTAAVLADAITGGDAPGLPTANDCASFSPPLNCDGAGRLNSLANSLGACINSSGPASSQCVELFNCATPGATFNGFTCTPPGGSTLAADTLTATLEIARNAGQVPAGGIYYIASRDALFTPELNYTPVDWSLGLSVSGGGLVSPSSLAVDASGNVWVTNYGASLSEFNPAGAALSGNSGYTGGGLSNPTGIAIDAGGNAWVANAGASSLSEFNAAGMAVSSSTGYTGGGLNAPDSIAIDGSGYVWAGNTGNSNLSKFNSSGAALSGSGYGGGGLDKTTGVTVDASGNIWAVNETNEILSEFSSGGVPVSTSGYSGGGMSNPTAIAIDPSGDLWITNLNSGVSEFNSAGMALTGSSGYTGGGISSTYGVAVDAGGNVWVANYGASSLIELNSAGAPLSGSSGYSSGNVHGPQSIAIDSSGNVWSTNSNRDYLTELIGAAVPTRTPLVSAITGGFTP
jgi:streptogramin lyase